MLDVKCEQKDNVKIYYLSGEVDTPRSRELSAQIDTSGCDEIIFDLTNLKYITSAGLRVLMETNQEMRGKGGRITVQNVNSEVDQIFDMVGFYIVIGD